MRTGICWVLAWVVALAVGSGCGDDADSTTGPTDGGMDASTGGDGGNGGTGGTTPPTPPPPRFVCGGETCLIPGEDLVDLFESLGFPLGSAPYSPCCTEEDNACGLVVRDDAGMACVPRPPPDPECPDIDIFGVLQPGCCIEDLGVCGVNSAQVGGGCLDATGGLGPVFGIELLPCGRSDGGTDDAGRE